MSLYGLDWIDRLPAELAGQQALLRCLLALCEADDSIRWLVIGCSLARGAGDRLSDLDLAATCQMTSEPPCRRPWPATSSTICGS